MPQRFDNIFMDKALFRGVYGVFSGNGGSVSLVNGDLPEQVAYLQYKDHPSCGSGGQNSNLIKIAVYDGFISWVVVRHALGCSKRIHHIEWEARWEVDIDVPTRGIDFISKDTLVTVPNGSGGVDLVQGHPVVQGEVKDVCK